MFFIKLILNLKINFIILKFKMLILREYASFMCHLFFIIIEKSTFLRCYI